MIPPFLQESYSSLKRREIIAFEQQLIQTPSVNGANPEREVAERVLDFARQCGLSGQLFALEAARPNVIISVGPQQPGGLLLVAHLDTVGLNQESDWRYPPFAGVVSDGRMYGRGACDNKGGLVAALTALLLLRPLQEQLHTPVSLVGVPDEESGATGRLGVRFLHESGNLPGSTAIYTYPGNDRIILGHRGVLRFRLRAHGKAFHTGTKAWQNSPKGYNAIVGMAETLSAIETLSFDDQVDAPDLFSPYRTVLTPTQIAGGSGPSMTPDFCEATVDIRLVPQVSRQTIETALLQTLLTIEQRRSPLKLDMQLEVYIPHTLIAAETPAVRALQHSSQQVLGSERPLAVSGPANESYLLNQIGIPTCVFGPSGENAHAVDEYVVVDSIFETALVYALTALELKSDQVS